jgi:hypothetical protein
MKRLLVAFLLLNAFAYAETPASVRIRVKLPFEPDSPGAVVLRVGTVVTVLWPQDDKLMVRYRRVEGLVPAVTINYVASEHPGDIRQYRPDPVPKDSNDQVARVERTANTYHPAPIADRGNESAMGGSFPVYKVAGGAALVFFVLVFSSRGRGKEDNDGPLLRRHS